MSNLKKFDIGKLERILNRNLSPEEQGEIELWEKGRALSHQVILPGWDVVLEMLQSYAEDSMRRLARIDPARKDDVLAEHAVYFAAHRIYNSFTEDVQQAVDASRKAPDVIHEQLKNITVAPPEDV